MMCDLDMTEGKSCILRSPLITETSNFTCMVMSYHLPAATSSLLSIWWRMMCHKASTLYCPIRQ